jgi:hypothetical protein
MMREPDPFSKIPSGGPLRMSEVVKTFIKIVMCIYKFLAPEDNGIGFLVIIMLMALVWMLLRSQHMNFYNEQVELVSQLFPCGIFGYMLMKILEKELRPPTEPLINFLIFLAVLVPTMYAAKQSRKSKLLCKPMVQIKSDV